MGEKIKGRGKENWKEKGEEMKEKGGDKRDKLISRKGEEEIKEDEEKEE